MEIFTGCLSDRGNYRAKNQDCAVCHVKKRKDSVLAVGCVCDGIGSFSQSEIAAEMVTEGISRWFEGIKKLFPSFMDEEMVVEDLGTTIEELNELVCDYRKREEIEIGCTMSVMLMVNNHYYIYHVGDSRIYRVNDGVCQITRDEVSLVENGGQIKSVLANFIGKSANLWMSRVTGIVEGKELFILGSDGLFKKLTFEDMNLASTQIKSDWKAQKACRNFIKTVLERGEQDNISCVLIYVDTVK